MNAKQQTAELLDALSSDRLEDRVTAIQVLGEIGGAEALGRLREHMKTISREHYALYVAIGKLKRKRNAE